MPWKKIEGKLPHEKDVVVGKMCAVGGESFQVLEAFQTKTTMGHRIFLIQNQSGQFRLYLPHVSDAKHDEKMDPTGYIERLAPEIFFQGGYVVADRLETFRLGDRLWQVIDHQAEGSEAHVLNVRDPQSMQHYIAKVFKPDMLMDKTKVVEAFSNSKGDLKVRMAKQARHEAKILKRLGRQVWCDGHVVVMEKMPGTTYAAMSAKCRKAQHPIPTSLKLKMVHAIFNAIHQCHQSGIAHRDLSADNVMVAFTHRGWPCTLDDILYVSSINVDDVDCHAHLIDFGQAVSGISQRVRQSSQLYQLSQMLLYGTSDQTLSGFKVEAAIEDVYSAMKFVTGFGTADDNMLHEASDLSYRMADISSKAHSMRAINQKYPNMLAELKTVLHHHPKLRALLQTYYQNTLRAAAKRYHKPGVSKPSLHHVMQPFCTLLQVLYTMTSIQESMSGQHAKPIVWLRSGQQRALNAALDAVYTHPTDLDVLEEALRHLTPQTHILHGDIRKDLMAFVDRVKRLQQAASSLPRKAGSGLPRMHPVHGVGLTGLAVADAYMLQMSMFGMWHILSMNMVVLLVSLMVTIAVQQAGASRLRTEDAFSAGATPQSVSRAILTACQRDPETMQSKQSGLAHDDAKEGDRHVEGVRC